MPYWGGHNFYLSVTFIWYIIEIIKKKKYLSSFVVFKITYFFVGRDKNIFLWMEFYMGNNKNVSLCIVSNDVSKHFVRNKNKNNKKKIIYKNIGYPWFLFTNDEMFTMNYLSQAFRWNISCFKYSRMYHR